jgi:hypothetical protein
MTVSATTNRISYTANGSVTVFAFPYPFYAATDLAVYLRDESVTPAVETLKVLTTDYTVNTSNGNVTFLAAPANALKVIIKRIMPVTQGQSYIPNDLFPAATQEQGLDRSVMISQQLDEAHHRSLRFSPTSAVVDKFVAEPVTGNYVAWDSNGNLQNKTPAQVMSDGGAALKANNLSDLPSASSARTNLGLGTSATHPSTDFEPANANIQAHIASTTGIHGATNANTASALVQRDASGNFAAGTVTANLVGNVTGNASGTAATITGSLTGDVISTGMATTLSPGAVTDSKVGFGISGSKISGNISGSAGNITGTAAIGNGGTGQTTKSAAFDALSPNTTKGDVTASNGTSNVRFPAGTDGKVLTADSSKSAGLDWTTPLTNPMTTAGDIIAGGSSGATNRVAGNTTTTKKLLAQTGDGVNSATPVWSTLVAGDVPTLNQNTTGSAGSFTGSLSGDVTGTQGATVIGNAPVIAKVLTGFTPGAGVVSSSDSILGALQKHDNAITTNASSIATNTTAIGSPTNLNTASQIVKRDGSGNFSAGTITAALTGNATTATSATTAGSITGNLTGEVTSSGMATTVTNAAVIAKTLTGFTSGAGTVSSADSLLGAIQKTTGNIAANTTSIATNTTNITTNTSSITALNTAVGTPTSSATASTLMKRDASANVAVNNFIEGFATTATSAGTTTLTVASAPFQQFTGTLTHSVNLPAANTLQVGTQYYVFNRSTGSVTVFNGSGSPQQSLNGGAQCVFTCTANGSTAGTWDVGLSGSIDAISPAGVKGDLIGRSSTASVRIAVGSDGQVPVADATQSSGIAWKTLQQGTKNYITYGSFENNATTGWSLAHSTLTTKIPTSVGSTGVAFSSGAGGSAASGNLSIATISSGQLSGTYSLNLASSAATTAGDLLISQAYTIDISDQAKMLNFRFNYKLGVDPGAANRDFSGTSTNSYAVYIYDVTNAAWIQPAGVYNLVQSTGVGIASGSFQAPSNMTQFQIAVVFPNATGGAASLYIDDVTVGPQTSVSAPAISDWTAYTPTYTALGTVATTEAYWRRVGSNIEMRGKFTAGAAGSASEARISMPAGPVSADTSQINTIEIAGTGLLGSASAAMTQILMEPNVSYVTLGFQTASIAGLTKQNGSQFNNFIVSWWAKVPVQGWSSSAVSSSDTDTRVVAATYAAVASASTTANTQINFDTKIIDTHSAVTTGAGTWKFTAPVSGIYEVMGMIAPNGTTAGQLYKNGSSVQYLGYINASGQPCTLAAQIQLNAGDYIDARMLNTLTLGGAAPYTNIIHIKRLSGPAVVQATESVNASYTTTAGASIPNNTTTLLIFPTKDYDSHGAYNTSTGVYTCPVSGLYSIKAQGLFASNVTGSRKVYVYKNTVLYRFMDIKNASGSNWVSGVASVKCVAGDTLDIRVFQDSGGALSMDSTAGVTALAIERVGN